MKNTDFIKVEEKTKKRVRFRVPP